MLCCSDEDGDVDMGGEARSPDGGALPRGGGREEELHGDGVVVEEDHPLEIEEEVEEVAEEFIGGPDVNEFSEKEDEDGVFEDNEDEDDDGEMIGGGMEEVVEEAGAEAEPPASFSGRVGMGLGMYEGHPFTVREAVWFYLTWKNQRSIGKDAMNEFSSSWTGTSCPRATGEDGMDTSPLSYDNIVILSEPTLCPFALTGFRKPFTGCRPWWITSPGLSIKGMFA